jgi:hypothetical protein
MGQVTIYLEKQIEQKMRNQAKIENRSLSQWISSLIKDKVNDEWPDQIAELAGQWDDFPSLDELRADQGEDTSREEI